MVIEPCADNFIPIVLTDEPEHTPEKPFCWNPACPCHEDELLVFEVFLHVQDGLKTPEEATDFVKGKGI